MPEPTIEPKNLPPFLSASSDLSAYEKRGSHHWALGASFGYALSGLWYAVRTQLNMRIHLSVTVAVLVLGLYVKLDWVQWSVLVLTIGAVLIAEMFNTVAEAALDATTPYYHPLIKIAKDVAAGAVLLTALLSILVGLLILGPPLWLKLVAWTESIP
jgi:undecaprenol kinase/diacylglycerol kinase (ATP)